MPITVGIAPAAKQIGAKRGVVSGCDTSNQIRLEMTSDSGLATWSWTQKLDETGFLLAKIHGVAVSFVVLSLIRYQWIHVYSEQILNLYYEPATFRQI